MSFTILSIAIFCITAAVVYTQIRKGYKNGMSRSLIHLAILLFCAVFSTLISVAIATAFGTFIFDIVKSFGVLDFSGEFAMLHDILGLLINMLFSLILYLPIFYLLKALLTWVINIICSSVSKKHKTRDAARYLSEDAPFYIRKDKAIGATVGLVSGLILSIVVFMPLTGLLKSSSDVIDLAESITGNTELESVEGVQLLKQYSNDAAINVFDSCGSSVLYDLSTRTSVAGHSTYLNKELEVIRSIDIPGIAAQLQSSGTVSPENLTVLENVLNISRDSLSLKLLMTDFVQNASSSWMSHTPYLNINRPSVGNYPAIDEFLDSVFYVCSTTTIDTFDADLTTVLNLISLMNEYSVLFTSNDYSAFMKEFVEGNALKRIESELSKNPHMQPLITDINALVMNVIATEVGGNVIPEDTRNRIYKGLASVLNDSMGLKDSVKLTAIANGITENFDANGIYLPSELKDRVASVLSQGIGSAETVSAQDVEEFFYQFLAQAEGE